MLSKPPFSAMIICFFLEIENLFLKQGNKFFFALFELFFNSHITC
ncbi:hypothetical protein Halhy_3587 [Haliscomenobacter hydrossis DSM 1100]|uniref:Uncharacterized protein n=1 Tax=Haliscomenobacter hydrossis (strain ATCC 27775 / DSM 1100 / LMG 10767 / O) TaxID=760192 RepID=F4KXT0_HALH1|nr:hypothetical protein Halhy_3587 [Haliscomenobacter hydrossis DSM 1100]